MLLARYIKMFWYMYLISLIAACIYRLVMISINLSETAHFVHWKSETTSETIFFLTNFFLNKKYFSWILSRTGFCLRLNFVSDFVSDYIPQLCFVCNHFIHLNHGTNNFRKYVNDNGTIVSSHTFEYY